MVRVAILEAATMQQNPALPVLERLRRDLQRVSRKGEQDPDDPENFSVGEPTFGTRTRLLIVDEPEQHLHPRAQREIAAWLAAGADNRDAFVATHALPFLDMPDERTSYFLVTRNNDGRTRATNISDNTFHALQQFSTEAGLSGRAEALQTIRIVALVEGAHDERVLRHFYGRELDRYRVLVVPVRGAKNVNAIVDFPWLSRMGFPFVVLFDETRASVVEGTKRPGGKDIAARAVWDMLHHWEDPRPPPYVASFGLADIFRALPEECVAKAVRAASGSFPGWADVDAAFEGRSSIGFKPLLLERSKLPPETDLDALLEAALDVCRVRPHEDLESAARTLIDYARMTIRPAATSTPRETV